MGHSDRVFQDRRDAGRALARLIDRHRGTPGLLVLALPRSGAPVDPGDCRLVGFTTYAGTVTAADDWAGPAERKAVRPALPGSVEELLSGRRVERPLAA